MSDQTSLPLLSIIVPVHNVAPYLERCVKSLANQTIANQMEVILVENGSTDDSLSECKRLAGEYEFLRVLVSDAVGPSAARNLGMDCARGEVVGFVDADDYVDADMFEGLMVAKNDFGADAAYCNYMLEYADGSERHPFPDTGVVQCRDVSDVVYDIIMEKSTSSPCVRVCDRAKLADCRFPVGVFYEDHAAIYRWMSKMDKIVHVDKPFYHYCIREGSTTQTTIGGTSKTKDYFYADVDRIPFVKQMNGISRGQQKELLRHVTRCALSHLKGYVMAIGDDGEDDAVLKEMRARMINETRGLSPFVIGVGQWMKINRLKFDWNGYFWHYRKRAHRKGVTR